VPPRFRDLSKDLAQSPSGKAFGSTLRMARSKRWKIPGATYHVMNRGNRKAIIFEDDVDRRMFVRFLIETMTEYGVQLLIGCLMGNHFHLIVVTPHANISEFMQQLEGHYAEYYNWRYRVVGHLYQGRFTGVVIESDLHLFTAAWYVFSNPVKAGFVDRAEDWKWSSYSATIGIVPTPKYLTLSWVGVLFPATSLDESKALLRRCMDDPQPINAYLQVVDPAMDAAIRSYIDERIREASQPCSCRMLIRPPLDQLFPKNQKKGQRRRAIRLAHETHGYKISEIARCIGVHPTTVSRIYRLIRPRKKRLKSGSDPESHFVWLKSGSDPEISASGPKRGGRRG
jgi:putative transposase